MEDGKIIDLYFCRSERALLETENKYGKLCRAISYNILNNIEDCSEIVNDAYMKLWNTIPPERPQNFLAYISKITRNLSINAYYKKRAQKRGGGETDVLLDELEECISSAADVEEKIIRDERKKELEYTLNNFLKCLEEENRNIFIRRYFFADSVKDIAERYGKPEGSIKSMLYRDRQKLKRYLEKEGVVV